MIFKSNKKRLNEDGVSIVSVLVGVAISSIVAMLISEILGLSFRGMISNTLNTDRRAIANLLISQVDCSQSFTSTTCTPASGLKILRDKNGAVIVNNVNSSSSFTRVGNFVLKAECTPDGKSLIARATTLASSGTLTSTADAHFQQDPVSKKIINWSDDESLVFPVGVGICFDSDDPVSGVTSLESAAIVSAQSVYMAGSGPISVTVPDGTKLVHFHATAHGNTGSPPAGGAEWESEDTIVSSGTIDLTTPQVWSGYRALTGGRSDTQNFSTIWNNQGFGAEVPRVGDAFTDPGWHGDYTTNYPRVDFNSSNLLTVSNLSPDPLTETVILFTYFK
ncbi:MAG: hypothetical protein NT027_06655 [Proteobacteria bacterium]|nr:hypothetical protein [Pseudomonadota bacterium]